MEKHIKVARTHRVLSWMYAVLALGFLAVFLSAGENTSIFGIVFIVAVFGGFFALHHVTAKGAFGRKRWARITSQGIALAMLLGFPIGTLIGIYLLANSWNGWES